METHKLHQELLQKTVEVLVVGCGGNGSALLSGLPFFTRRCWRRGIPMGCT
jgi:hypothetical protein